WCQAYIVRKASRQSRVEPCVLTVTAPQDTPFDRFQSRTPMTDFAAARRNMVEGQVRTADVTDLRIQTAMLEIPRENFVPSALAALAYLDLDLPVGEAGWPRLLCPLVLPVSVHPPRVASPRRPS